MKVIEYDYWDVKGNKHNPFRSILSRGIRYHLGNNSTNIQFIGKEWDNY